VFVTPRGIAIGMLNLALISPLLALAIAELFDLPPELAVGLVLLGPPRRNDGQHATTTSRVGTRRSRSR
jgi:hypothetical protein